MKKNTLEKTLTTIILLIYILLMFRLGTMPDINEQIPGAIFLPASLKHILGMSGLIAVFNVWAKTFSLKNYIIYSIIFASIIGLLIEIIQLQIPYRHFSYLDLIYNSIGIVLGLILIWPIIKKIFSI